MPRLSSAIHYGPAEVLYATADSLARTAPGSSRATQLKDRLEHFIREDHVRQLLCGSGIKLDRQDSRVTITIENEALSREECSERLQQLATALERVL